jgi:hypothetical protein
MRAFVCVEESARGGRNPREDTHVIEDYRRAVIDRCEGDVVDVVVSDRSHHKSIDIPTAVVRNLGQNRWPDEKQRSKQEESSQLDH